ncbi:MAG: tRNA (adenosine(37)-N6)-dimethylallyltransferase MiaA [bacterium]|nr:tRNA (adenosine(37)-N6)-dimethylallyltransferase MiaA [bacterium]
MKILKKLIVITGPTAVGKTAHAIGLALLNKSPIISADSRQVYSELGIGVAKPDAEQLAKVKHYFIDHVSIHDHYNAGRYAKEARELINQLFLTHDTLIICGGTGLYINALINGLDILPDRNDALREELQTIYNSEGLLGLQFQLKNLNPSKYESMDIQNPQRLIRAIEIEKSEAPAASNLPNFEQTFETEYIQLEMSREILYTRINQRVDQMIAAGLEAEAKAMEHLQHLNALQTVGYSEWWPYFRGEVTREQVIDKIKQHTRNYAKRQLTWFRHKQ